MLKLTSLTLNTDGPFWGPCLGEHKERSSLQASLPLLSVKYCRKGGKIKICPEGPMLERKLPAGKWKFVCLREKGHILTATHFHLLFNFGFLRAKSKRRKSRPSVQSPQCDQGCSNPASRFRCIRTRTATPQEGLSQRFGKASESHGEAASIGNQSGGILSILQQSALFISDGGR